MTTSVPVDSTEYRIVLIHPRCCGICVLERENQYRLIRAVVPHNERAAHHLQNALRALWGVSTVVLEILITDDGRSPCAVAELLDLGVPVEIEVIRQEQLACDELSEQEQTSLDMILNGDTQSRFTKIGWIDEAIAWLEASTGQRVSSKAAVDQYNASGAFTLVRFRIKDGCNFWLKAAGAPHEQEGRVTSLLSRLCPGSIPDVIAERPAWNAWLMRDEGGHISSLPVDPFETMQLLQTAVASLAELQISTAGSVPDLLHAGAADHRTGVLLRNAGVVFDYITEAMRRQISTKVHLSQTGESANSRASSRMPVVSQKGWISRTLFCTGT